MIVKICVLLALAGSLGGCALIGAAVVGGVVVHDCEVNGGCEPVAFDTPHWCSPYDHRTPGWWRRCRGGTELERK